MLEALCRQSSTTLDIVHAEDGPPITQRTSGLEKSRQQAQLSVSLTRSPLHEAIRERLHEAH